MGDTISCSVCASGAVVDMRVEGVIGDAADEPTWLRVVAFGAMLMCVCEKRGEFDVECQSASSQAAKEIVVAVVEGDDIALAIEHFLESTIRGNKRRRKTDTIHIQSHAMKVPSRNRCGFLSSSHAFVSPCLCTTSYSRECQGRTHRESGNSNCCELHDVLASSRSI